MTQVYKFLFQKLCRDKVKDILTQKGLTATSKTLDGEAYLQSLKAKIVEEASEKRFMVACVKGNPRKPATASAKGRLALPLINFIALLG